MHLECHREGKAFDATLAMKGQEFTTKGLLALLVKTPVMAIKVTLGIYWHALKLWMKGVPIHDHPNTQKKENNRSKENTQ